MYGTCVCRAHACLSVWECVHAWSASLCVFVLPAQVCLYLGAPCICIFRDECFICLQKRFCNLCMKINCFPLFFHSQSWSQSGLDAIADSSPPSVNASQKECCTRWTDALVGCPWVSLFYSPSLRPPVLSRNRQIPFALSPRGSSISVSGGFCC